VPVRYRQDQDESPVLRAALRAHKAGQSTAALHGYERRLQQDASCLDAWMNLGSLQARAGRAEEAARAFRHAANLAPHDARVFRDIGIGLLTIGRLADAARALEHSVRQAPELVGSWLHLARTRLEVSDRASAVAAAQRATALRHDDPSAWLLLARCAYDDDSPLPALNALHRAERCSRPLPEVRVFHWLLSRRARANGHAVDSSEAINHDASALLADAPQLYDLVDAAQHLDRRMANARWLSSARDTLRFAASAAPRQGNVVELGVFHGVSLRWLAECRPGSVHGFDSFVGLPSDWDPVPEGRFTTAGRVPRGIDAQFWVGTFDEQLPRFVAQHPEPIALLHVDSDLYESARVGLAHLSPLLAPGSVLIFDEYFGHHSWRQDEFRAFAEAVSEHGWRYETIAANPFTGQAVVRLEE